MVDLFEKNPVKLWADCNAGLAAINGKSTLSAKG
jgi:hypothetical protein